MLFTKDELDQIFRPGLAKTLKEEKRVKDQIV